MCKTVDVSIENYMFYLIYSCYSKKNDFFFINLPNKGNNLIIISRWVKSDKVILQ